VIPCQNCHTTTSWSPLRAQPEFDHDTDTRYPLRGMHADVACNSCHVSKIFTDAGTQCANCHADFHKRQFGAACENCHTVQGWRVNTKLVQDHWNRFPLLGAHATTPCDGCHTGAATGVYVGLSTQCFSCHQRDYQTPVINHRAAGFPTNCEQCHSVLQWQVAKFDHSITGFTLTGSHQTLACVSCHAGGRFQGTPVNCFGCHQPDFTSTNNPNHAAAGFSTDCSQCHNTATWDTTNFNHNLTKFPLTGGHVGVACSSCHANNQFVNISTGCVSCHLKDMQGATDPNHVAAGFPQDCSLCHTTVNWTSATFNHSATKFPLTGKHATVACATCHIGNQFATLSTACVSCHLPDMQGTNNPNHIAAGFSQDCSQCHSTVDWNGATFNHNATKFPLTGKHATVDCATCHANNQFATLSTSCVNCHLKDMQGTTSPNHVAAGFSQDCSQCHSTADWNGATFNHNATKFPLTGKHATVDCATCHVNNQFATLSTACVNCHLKDMQGTTNPNHVAAAFSQDCSQCHSTVDWNGATFNHTATKFPLTGKHATVDCATCHANNQFATLSTACVNCHLKDMQSTTNPNHVAAGFPQDCSLCHSTIDWTGSSFNHNATPFPLTGAHATVLCATCHANNNFTSLGTACGSCHLKDMQGANDPNHVAAGFPQDCSQCHTTANWLGAKFDHTAQTKFPLTGKHASVDCITCHTNNQYATLSTTCITCHLKDMQSTTNPNHVAAGFSQECQICHSTVDWGNAAFNHNATRFPLTGAHATVACASCHVNNQFTTVSTACVSCHLSDFQSTNNPPHVSAGFPQDCSQCHTTTNWDGATFNHASTGFTLTGTHSTTACNACHVNNNFSLTSAACFNCHQKDWQGTNNPPHAAAGFPQDCSQCHNTTNWNGATFNHATTGFTLTGAHTTVSCTQCHVNNNFGLTSAACYGCHQADFNGTNNPPHVSQGFPQDCSQCHTTTSWAGATFNHNATGFPLTGAHTSVQCTSCHVNNNFNLTSAACFGCHQSDWASTNNPPHAASGFPQDCSQCHNTTSWAGATFNHNTTGFPLTGAHVNTTCSACHVNNNFTLNSAACYGCHQKDYQGTNNPPHASANFPQDCSQCHTTTDWSGATFNHNSTGFALTGMHATIACNACHVNNNFTLNSTACYGCHQKDYQGTNNPPHASSGFPQDCSQCHTTVNWLGATFNHNSTGFALTGMHATIACSACHVNNNFSLTSTACYGCHVADWNSTNNPPHAASGFPQDCSQCHTTTNWAGATFNHATTGFTLTGAHTSLACNACHVNNNFTLTSTACYGCHVSDWTSTNNPPHQASGFPQDCSQCHTTTNWAGATFNHTTTGFTLTGAHTSLACNLCHVNNNFTLNSTACYGCHVNDYNGATSPNHSALGYPQDCSLCHSTTNFTSATFNHTTVGFNLVGKHATISCTLCHVGGNFTTTPTDCYSCHSADYKSTTNPNHAAAGFPTTCLTCHPATIIDWTGATFNHTWFPMTHGNANSVCSNCHTNSSDYSVFSCTGCHLQAQTTSQHSGVRGFVYNSANCYSCHPQGRAG